MLVLKRLPSWLAVNTAEMYPEVLAVTIAAILLHIPQDKSDKTREPPTYWGLKELTIWRYGPTKAPHIPGLEVGGGGGGIGVYFD